jgi:Zn-dependent metalloprotease
MEAKIVSERLYYNPILTRLMAQEDFTEMQNKVITGAVSRPKEENSSRVATIGAWCPTASRRVRVMVCKRKQALEL